MQCNWCRRKTTEEDKSEDWFSEYQHDPRRPDLPRIVDVCPQCAEGVLYSTPDDVDVAHRSW